MKKPRTVTLKVYGKIDPRQEELRRRQPPRIIRQTHKALFRKTSVKPGMAIGPGGKSNL